MPDAASGLVYYVVFLFSTTLHEASHAWAAKLGGDLTAYKGGQVTLDPRPHIRREPFGMVILPLLTALLPPHWPFGFASAPFDPAWALRHPRRAGWMALAGPASNLLLMLLAGVTIRVLAMAGIFTPPESANFGHLADTSAGGIWPGLALLISVFFSLNLALAILNMFPVPPLDGSAVVTLLLNDTQARRYQEFLLTHGGAFAIFGIIIAWKLFAVVFSPLFLLGVSLLYPGVSYS